MIKYLGIIVLVLGLGMFFALAFNPQGMSGEGYILAWGITLVGIFSGPAIWQMAGRKSPFRKTYYQAYVTTYTDTNYYTYEGKIRASKFRAWLDGRTAEMPGNRRDIEIRDMDARDAAYWRPRTSNPRWIPVLDESKVT